MGDHDRDLASAFDDQAARFERAPVQTSPVFLDGLVEFAALLPDSLVLDAGCGPGLVAEALLRAGHRVRGYDLSAEMVRRARERCAPFGERAAFEQRSMSDLSTSEPFDAALSRLVVHHVPDPIAFIDRQVALVREGGVLVLCDHITDPNPERARWHQGLERDRDHTHTQNLTGGELCDLLASSGLREIHYREVGYALDFDEWFDRGSPAAPKAEVRARLLAGAARGFSPTPSGGGAIRIDGIIAMLRAIK
jgi:SAM-dependent methyltransferase